MLDFKRRVFLEYFPFFGKDRGLNLFNVLQSHVQFDNAADENYCHPIVYAIASEMTTALYTIIGVTLCSAFTALIFNQN